MQTIKTLAMQFPAQLFTNNKEMNIFIFIFTNPGLIYQCLPLDSMPELFDGLVKSSTGWPISIVILLVLIYGCHDWVIGELPDPFVSALYDATQKIFWSLAICWILFTITANSEHEKQTIVEKFFCHKFFKFMGRLTLVAYLMHPIVQSMLLSSQQQHLYSSTLLMAYVIIVKTGKQRKDRYYHLAKETGYRSRAAFKLIQLNRKFEFLQRSKVLIDLCAAPGGWLQVAQKYMPVSSVVVGVDLVPIKNIHNVITIQDDITTKHCRTALQKELKTWKADVVLHDGAGNVGKSWLHDAFNQNRLTLSALSLATEFLMKGGWFVTKVFRSKDYNSLMWVFKKLFNKVHATKPQASRNESAEIFVVCQGYTSPDKIDPKFFDPTFVFEEVEDAEESERKIKTNLLKPGIKQKKAKADGYADGDYTLYHKLKASEFISSKNHIQLLSDCSEKKAKADGYADGDYTLYHKLKASEFISSKNHIQLLSDCSEIIMDTKEIKDHRLTTPELIECCQDIKVLGRKELIALIDWRKKLRADLIKEEKTTKDEAKEEDVIEEEDISEVDEADGYADGDYTLYHKLKASEFISSKNHIQLLSDCSEIIMDTKEIQDHRLTTPELIECCQDIKVLGRKELIALIDWRKKLRTDLIKEEKTTKDEAKEEDVIEEEDISEVDEVDRHMDEEARELKRKKRKILKEKRKLNERMNLKMILKNDELIEEELELFQLKNIRNKKLLNQIEEINLSDVEVDVEEDNDNGEQTFKKSDRVVYDRDDRLKSAHDFDDSGNEEEEEKSESEGIADEDIEIENDLENGAQESDEDDDGLVVDLIDSKESKRNKTKMFFESQAFTEEMDDEDDDIELELIENRLKNKNKIHDKREKKPNKRQIEEEIEDSDDMSSEDESDLRPKKKQKNVNKANEKCKKDVKLNPQELAIGTLMIKSQKTKRDILDNAWNRYVQEDDEFLPSWFRKDEEKYFRKPLPVTQEMVKEYKQQLREINARPIKKVTEAKARHKKKALIKLERARKRAEYITNAPDMTNTEKAQHIKNAYKKALKGNKKEVTYVVTKKHQGKRAPKGIKGRYKKALKGNKKEVTYVVTKKHQGKRAPKGIKGRYKVVDQRMKKDKKNDKTNTKGKNNKKPNKSKNNKNNNKSKQRQKPSKNRR
ncbi:unnamed protein product, partial [Medioppia subpectinata]